MAQYISALLAQAMDSYADNPALSIGKQQYNYAELFKPAQTMGEKIALGCNKNSCVAVLADKTFEGYQCIAAAFFSNRTYVPLNAKYPVERNAAIVQQSGAQLIIYDASCQQQLDALQAYLAEPVSIMSVQDVDKPVKKSVESDFDVGEKLSTQTAYLLFTSGTTGQPKGVPISDQNIAAYVSNVVNTYAFSSSDRFSQFFDFTFDLSLHDMLICWYSGACLCPANKAALLMPLQFAKRNRISVWFSVPSLALTAKDVMRDRFHSFELPDIRLSFFCGEALPQQLANNWAKITSNKPVINLYGPTEATIAFTAFTYQPNTSEDNTSVVSIGEPFGNNTCLLLDENGQSVKQGELCLAGPQVFASYLEPVDGSTVQHEPFHHVIDPSGRTVPYYRTGDVCSINTNGLLIYHGRNDRQVQVKGFRVELQEVEHVLREICTSGTVAVIAYPVNSIGEATGLTAFISQANAISPNELRRKCGELLPVYMLPEQIVTVDAFPFNSSGKLDYRQLLAMARNLT